uniref:SFRICE_027294 n=1 Tax=Spodoptera frugiperda TaxID=7108 RepID=A0A2H1WJ53_SPOFR
MLFMCGRAMLLHEYDTTASQKTDVTNALVTFLVLRVSMGGGDCLPSEDSSARLPDYTIKKY